MRTSVTCRVAIALRKHSVSPDHANAVNRAVTHASRTSAAAAARPTAIAHPCSMP